MSNGKLLRMDNVGIVVESLDEAVAFFAQARAEEGAAPAADPRRHAVESLWRGHRVCAGAYYPVVDARHAARAVAAHYRLQGW